MVLKWSGRNREKNFVARVSYSTCFDRLLSRQTAHRKGLLSGRKTRYSSSCRGRIIALNTEMARVAEVKRGKFVCEFHYQQLRKRNNICSCLLPSHSSTLSKTSITTRLNKVFDEGGRSIESYRPGTRWCTICRISADKTFATQITNGQ